MEYSCSLLGQRNPYRRPSYILFQVQISSNRLCKHPALKIVTNKSYVYTSPIIFQFTVHGLGVVTVQPLSHQIHDEFQIPLYLPFTNQLVAKEYSHVTSSIKIYFLLIGSKSLEFCNLIDRKANTSGIVVQFLRFNVFE